jgi:tRNA A37 threonylcarbamoyladenosine synthetase subunit TsaC/SUA5/YrdC
MAYGVVATSPRAVNALKGRRLDQNVAVSLHNRSQWQQVARCIDLSPAALDATASLLRLRVTVLVPLRAPHPPWVTPAVRDGWLAAFNGWWAPTARLWDRFPRLYGSSANLTGEPPAPSAAAAAGMFGAECVVVNAGAFDHAPGPRWASTMVRIDRAGLLDLYRTGANDAVHGREPRAFLRHLSATVGLPDPPATHVQEHGGEH